MSNRTGNIILLGMVAGAIIGALGGYYFGDIFIELKFLGTLFLNALKMIVIPLIVASMIVGVTSLGDIRKLGRTTGKTLVYYLVTTGCAVIIGIVLVNIIQPGVGMNGVGNEIPDVIKGAKPTTYSDFIVSLIPENLIGAAAENSVLPLILFSLVFGGVLTSIGRKGRAVINFFEGLNEAIMKIVILIIYFAPIGILGIIGGIVAEKHDSIGQIVSGLGLYSLTVILGLLIHAVIILPLILKFFGRKSPLKYFTNMGQALATAFTTASSSATLPVTIDCVTEKNKVSSQASSFVLPLGATINMDGTALYEAVAAIFIAQAIGFPLSISSQVIIFLTATLASIGAAAIPHAGLVTMVIVLSAVGLPLEGIGFIFAIDWFLDRCRTTVNVWGDSIGAAVIGETSEIKTYSARSPKPAASRQNKTYQKKSRPKPDRPGRKQNTSHERPQRGNRQAKYDRQDQGNRRHDRDRSKNQKSRSYSRNNKPDHKQNGDAEHKHRPAPTTATVKPAASKNQQEPSAAQELDKIRKQLDSIGAAGNEPKAEVKNDSKRDSQPDNSTGKKKGDDFFDAKFSKMDLFGKSSKNNSGSDENPESEPVAHAGDIRDNKKDEPHADKSAPVNSNSEKNSKDNVKKEPEETPDEDSWGREKKKRPSR